MRLRLIVGVVLAVLVVTGSAATAPGSAPLPPNGTLFGASYGEWMLRYMSWVSTTPTATNPFLHNKSCRVAPQPGTRVFFLTASVGGKLTLSCTIPSGQGIFVVVADLLANESSPKDTFAVLRAGVGTEFKGTTVLRASIDGQPVPDLRSYRAETRNFVLKLPADNLFQTKAGPTRFVAGGYNLLIPALPPGKHTIVTYTEFKEPGQPVFKAGMTYHLTVK